MSVLKVALCCLLAIGMVAAEVVPNLDAEDVEETDEGASELEADTPTRQAQRSMLAEREAATAVHREEDVLGMRMMQVEEGAETEADKKKKKAPASRGRRVSGAARSFLPNDKMCVMCQFLTERIALDLLGRASPAIAGPYGGYSYGSDGNPPMAMIGGVAPAAAGKDSFIEMSDEEAEEEADEEADTEEVEGEEADDAEAEEEVEEESEDLALLQISEEEEEESEEEADAEDESEEEADEESEDETEADEESDEEAVIEDATDEEEAASEWTTPLYSLAETDASTSSTASSDEESGDFQTPQYIDAVYQNNAEEMTEEEQTETDEGTTDSSEPTFFESQASVNTNDDTEWTTPEYTNEKVDAAPAAEATAFIEVSQSDAGWTTPQYTDAAVEASGKKEYARVLVSEEEEAEEEEPALIEQAAESEVKFFTPRIIRSRKSRGGKGPFRVFFHTPRRYRASDAIVPRPRWNRHGQHTPHRKMARVIGTAAFRMAEHAAYDRLETYCSTRLPEVYGRYCRPMLRNFRHITEGLRYGDRVGQVCMQVNLCKKSSYIAKSPHVQHGIW